MRPARRLGLRFLSCYTPLYCLYAGGPIAHVFLGIRTRPQATAKPPIAHIIVPWIAAHVLHLANPITTFTNGSGDTTYDWLLTSLLALVAAVAGAIWTSMVRKAPYDANLRLWLRFGIHGSAFRATSRSERRRFLACTSSRTANRSI